MVLEPRSVVGIGTGEGEHAEAKESGTDGATTLPEADQRARSVAEDSLTRVKRLRDDAEGLRAQANGLRNQAETFREKGEMAEAKELMAEAKELMAEAKELEDRAEKRMAEAEKFSESRAKDLLSTCAHFTCTG